MEYMLLVMKKYNQQILCPVVKNSMQKKICIREARLEVSGRERGCYLE